MYIYIYIYRWTRTTLATGFSVKRAGINPGAPGFVYPFYPHTSMRRQGGARAGGGRRRTCWLPVTARMLPISFARCALRQKTKPGPMCTALGWKRSGRGPWEGKGRGGAWMGGICIRASRRR